MFLDPMQIDTRNVSAEGEDWDDGEGQEGLDVREGRQQRPVLRGNSINFHNIDGLRSLMVAWKKLVNTSMNFRREAKQHLQRRVNFANEGGGSRFSPNRHN